MSSDSVNADTELAGRLIFGRTGEGLVYLALAATAFGWIAFALRREASRAGAQDRAATPGRFDLAEEAPR